LMKPTIFFATMMLLMVGGSGPRFYAALPVNNNCLYCDC
jgi:hypothetical protein